jgi:hypothetical protein
MKKLVLILTSIALLAVFLTALVACSLYGLGERVIVGGEYFFNAFERGDEHLKGVIRFESGNNFVFYCGEGEIISRGSFSFSRAVVSFAPTEGYEPVPNMSVKGDFIFVNCETNFVEIPDNAEEIYTRNEDFNDMWEIWLETDEGLVLHARYLYFDGNLGGVRRGEMLIKEFYALALR